MDAISRAWRDIYQGLFSITPLWWAILAVVAVLGFFAFLLMRGR